MKHDQNLDKEKYEIDAMDIEKLGTLARTGNMYMRKWAVKRLGFLGGHDAVSELIKAADDPDGEVALEACVGLRDYCPEGAVEPLLRALQRQDSRLVSNAARTLGEIGDSRCVEPLLELLKVPDTKIRGGAAAALGGFKEDRVENALLELLSTEQDWHVVISTVGSLGRLRCFAALDPMVEEMLVSQDAITHNHILDALARFAGGRVLFSHLEDREDAAELLDNLMENAEGAASQDNREVFGQIRMASRNDDMRGALHQLAAEITASLMEVGEEASDLYRHLEDQDPQLCACVMLLERLSREDVGAGPGNFVDARDTLAISTFITMLFRIEELEGKGREKESTNGILFDLVEAEGREAVELVNVLLRKGPQVEDELIQNLISDEGQPSHYAAEVLGRMGSTEAIPHLINSLDSDDWTLAERASDALGRIGEPALDSLVEFIKGGDEEGRMYACSSLAKIGGDKALEVLLGLLDDPMGISRPGTVVDLAEMGDAKAIEPLRKLMSSDPSYEVRKEARYAVLQLCRMHGVEVPELEDLEAEARESERKVEAFSNLGSRGRSPMADLYEPLERNLHEFSQQHEKIGRNDPCPCGSSKKYKKCCLKKVNREETLYDEQPLTTIFRCRECGWEYETNAGTAFIAEDSDNIYFSEEIRCPKCQSNSYELTAAAYTALLAELSLIASEGSRRKERGQEPPAGTAKFQSVKGVVDGQLMSPEEGVKYYEEKIEDDPTKVEYHLRLGNCLCWINEYDKAIDAYERAQELAPGLVDSLHALGRIYLDRGEAKHAKEYLERARMSVESGGPLLSREASREEVREFILEDLDECLPRKSGRGEHCISCGKPTRSHLLDSGEYMCHKCWVKESQSYP